MHPISRLTSSSAVLSLGLAGLSTLLGGACGDSAGATSKGLTATSALVVLSSDYKSSSASIYDPATKTLVDDCVPPSALSKDTALPTGPQGGEIVVLDREHSFVDFVDPHACHVRAQLSVSTGGFKSNPHDVVHVSATKAYVTRYEKNAAPTPAPDDFDEGDDLLIIDPSAPKVTGRIDMSSYAAMVAGATLQARPDHALLANGLVYVTLNNLAGDFSAAGPGRVVVIDPATDMVTATVDLADQTGCSGLTYDDATKRLYVSCGGEFTDADQTAASALVEIDVSGALPALGKIVSGKNLGAEPVSYNAAAVLGGTAYAATAGALDPKSGAQTAPDAFYAIALATGAATKLLDGGAFNLGRPVIDAATKTLFLPDGDAVAPRVRVFDISAAPVAGTPFEPNPAEHLPPREAARY
jgi:hypothetical protein